MLARRLATASAAALLATLLAAVPSAPAGTIRVPAARAAQDGADDPIQLDLDALPDNGSTNPQGCTDATGQPAAGDPSADDPSQDDDGDPAGGTRARLRQAGSAAEDVSADAGADDVATGDTVDDTGADDPGSDGMDEGSGDAVCDDAPRASDRSGVVLSFDGVLSAGVVDTGSVVFHEDGRVVRELDLATSGAPRAAAASKRGGKGRARTRGTIVLAKVERKVAKGRKVSLKPKLTAAGRKALKRIKANEVKVVVRTTFRPKHGKPRTSRTTLTLHRA